MSSKADLNNLFSIVKLIRLLTTKPSPKDFPHATKLVQNTGSRDHFHNTCARPYRMTICGVSTTAEIAVATETITFKNKWINRNLLSGLLYCKHLLTNQNQEFNNTVVQVTLYTILHFED